MPLPISLPYTFANATTAIPLANLDSDLVTLRDGINGIGNGTNALSNVVITGGTIDGTSIGATTSSTGRFSTVTATTGNITTVNATTLNAATHRSDTSLTFQSNGTTTAMTVDTSQNVGIGTSSPSGRLHVRRDQDGTTRSILQNRNASGTPIVELDFITGAYDLSDNRYAYIQSGGSANQYLAFGNGEGASPTEKMRINSAGNVGIGTTSPSRQLSISNATQSNIQLTNTAAGSTTTDGFQLQFDGSYNYVWGYENVPTVFGTNNSERARIDTSGNLLVGKTASNGTTDGIELRANGSIFSTRPETTNAASTMNVYSSGASAFRFYVEMDGKVNATNTTIAAISDQRLKENVRDIDVGLAAIMALKPRQFDWKTGKGKNIKNDRGWIAQEFEQVFPEMVGTWKDPSPEGEEPYKSVCADLIPVLVKAIQELKAQNDELKARVAALENA